MSTSDTPVLVEYHNGAREWTLNGAYHHATEPAITRADGSYTWCLYGRRHRIGGPALTAANGLREWYVHGEPHREDGPAFEPPSGACTWMLRGNRFSKEDHGRLMALSPDARELAIVLLGDGIPFDTALDAATPAVA